MSAKHTPGPWKASADWTRDVYIVAGAKDGPMYLATVHPGDDVADGYVDLPAEANARLIAAAPDLLEALRAVAAAMAANDLGDLHDAEPLVLAALAKAERGAV